MLFIPLRLIGALLFASAPLLAAASLEVRELGSKSLKDGKTFFVNAQNIPDSELYVGFRVDATASDDGKLALKITHIALSGFIDLEAGKRAPITTIEEHDFLLAETNEEWSELTTPKGLQLSVRWSK